MTLMMKSRRIKDRLSALEPGIDRPVFQLIDASHPLPFYIGREITGEHLLLLVEPAQPTAPSGLKHLSVQAVARSDGNWALVLKLTSAQLLDVFALLCEDMLDATATLSAGAIGSPFVNARLSHWRRLLSSGAGDVLSREAVRGLYGELHYLESRLMPEVGAIRALNAWKGPLGSDQDFEIDQRAIELKTVQPDAEDVVIASERQLHSEYRALTLVVSRLLETPNGESLNHIVDRMRASVGTEYEAAVVLDERLSALGFYSRPEYDTPTFDVVDQVSYKVNSQFPRIRPPDLPAGVHDVRYQIKLSACESFASLLGD
jgi:hypothetical protein